jgi:hypothetical protein
MIVVSRSLFAAALVVFDLGAQVDARDAAQTNDRGAKAVARGAARCASQVVDRVAQAVARGVARFT